ncbi:carbohydrate binding domain-containing protein [Streptosporangium canum]|uniref:carbohydrate binding domain-containing protein n=1 Tax=Streptosporangium canum TaxID=324952 RepID=UPI00343A60EF
MRSSLRRALRLLTVTVLGLAGVAVPLSAALAANSVTVYYATTWTGANLHYQPTGGTWTPVPGVTMDETACAGWKKKTLDLGTATGLKAAFNNGSGAWDNNNGADYAIGTGLTTVKDGVVRANATEPCTPEPPDTTAPSVPTGLTATAEGTTVKLSWNEAGELPGPRPEYGPPASGCGPPRSPWTTAWPSP